MPVGDGSAHHYGIKKASGVQWFGAGAGSSILKLKGGSTAGGSKDPQLIYGVGTLSNLAFVDLGFNLNSKLNAVKAGQNCTALWFNGDSADSTEPDSTSLVLRGLLVRRCTFRNGAGANVILVQNVVGERVGVPAERRHHPELPLFRQRPRPERQ